MSLLLRDAVQEFVTRIEDSMQRLDDAIEAADVDAQRAAFDAIIGQIEMLRSAADDGGEEEGP